MRRFGFFLGVFSVGLVVFLVFTGQLTKLFDSKPNGEPTRAGQSTDAAPPHVRFPFTDFQRNRELFNFTGVVEPETSLNISMEWNSAWTLHEAKLEIPIYDGDTSETTQRFVIHSKKVRYQPKPQCLFLEEVRGQGDDGTQFSTDAVELTWNESGEMRLIGRMPVQLAYPALQLHGQHGFVGEIGSNAGLRSLEIPPPVMVAIHREQGGSLFGLKESAAQPSEKPRDAAPSSKTRVFLRGDGPLRFHRDPKSPSIVYFDEDVTIFQSEARELWPAPTIPATRLECGPLELVLDANTQQLSSARTTSLDQKVAFFVEDQYTVRGKQLTWSAGEAEALLDGDVEVHGPQGVFSAARARILPLRNTCLLEEDISARLFVATLLPQADPDSSAAPDDGSQNSSDDPTSSDATPSDATPSDVADWTQQQLESDLELSVDFASIEYYASGDTLPEGHTSRLKSFRATSAPGKKVRIRQLVGAAVEDANVEGADVESGGAELVGESLHYDPRTQTVSIVGGETEETRPVFRQGPNLIRAHTIEFRRALQEVAFLGGVRCRLFKIPMAPGEVSQTLIVPRQPARPYDISGDELRVRFDPKSQLLVELEVKGETAPFAFETMFEVAGRADQDFYRMQGEHLIWRRDWNPETESEENEARLSGSGVQTLEAWGTKLLASQITFDPTQWLARAEGDVRVQTTRAQLLLLKQQTPKEGTPDREVELSGDRIELQLGKVADKDDPKKTELRLLFARAWASPEKQVVASDGEFSILATEVDWHANEAVIHLKGDGRQELRYGPSGAQNSELGTANANQISARTISINSATRRATLDGDIIGTIHQSTLSPQLSSTDGNTVPPTSSRPQLPWTIRAGRVELQVEEVSVGDETELVLTEVLGENNVSLVNTSLGLRFQGSAFSFAGDRQLVRLYSTEGQGPTQILTRTLHTGEVDEILAREIRIGRVRNRGVHQLNVLFDDRVNALFHETKNASGSRKNRPENFQLNCQHLLLIVDARKNEAAEQGAAKRLQEALAWDNVQFRAGNRNVFADRASYKRSIETLTFHSGAMKVQYNDGRRSSTYKSLSLKIDRAGRYIVDMVGGQEWNRAELEEALRLLRDPK